MMYEDFTQRLPALNERIFLRFLPLSLDFLHMTKTDLFVNATYPHKTQLSLNIRPPNYVCTPESERGRPVVEHTIDNWRVLRIVAANEALTLKFRKTQDERSPLKFSRKFLCTPRQLQFELLENEIPRMPNEKMNSVF